MPDAHPVTYREATAADAPAVAALHAASWRAAYRGILSDEFLDSGADGERLAFWHRQLARPSGDRCVLLAEEEGTLIGLACVLANADPRWGSFLDNLHVRPDLRGRGLGRALLRQAAAWVERRHPGVPFHLWVYEKNEPARRFYERLGAVVAERAVKEAPGGGTVVALHCVWPDVEALLAALAG